MKELQEVSSEIFLKSRKASAAKQLKAAQKAKEQKTTGKRKHEHTKEEEDPEDKEGESAEEEEDEDEEEEEEAPSGPMEVLTDVLVSLLAKPSALLRDVVLKGGDLSVRFIFVPLLVRLLLLSSSMSSPCLSLSPLFRSLSLTVTLTHLSPLCSIPCVRCGHDLGVAEDPAERGDRRE